MTITDIPFADNLHVAKVVRDGIPARALKLFAETLNLKLSEIAAVASIPRRTLERRMADNSRLRMSEAERVVRLARIFAKAEDVFEDREEAAQWLTEPLDALEGQTPLQASGTEPGAREVELVLGRIEHGVFG